jgi:hypothetical protein
MNKATKKIIAREGLIILGFILFYIVCLSAVFFFPFATTLGLICVAVIALIVLGYLLYLVARFVNWAVRVLKEE